MTFLLWPHLRAQPRMTFVGMSRRYGIVDIFGCDFKAAQQVEEGPFCSFARSLSDSVSSSPRRRKRVGDQNNGERTPSAESLRSSPAHSVSIKRKRNLDFGEREGFPSTNGCEGSLLSSGASRSSRQVALCFVIPKFRCACSSANTRDH